MNIQDRKAILKEKLNKATAIHSIVDSPEFKQYLLPALQELSTVQTIDPSIYSNQDEYQYKLDTANRRAIANKEILKFFTEQEGLMSYYTAEIKKLDLQVEL